jgi:hypothetical protein
VRALESRLDQSILPTHVKGIEVERQQVFALGSQTSSELTLVPVRFEAPTSGGGQGTGFQCGIYLVPKSGKESFVSTIGTGRREALQCEGLSAVGAMTEVGDKPRLILLYRASSPNATVREPVVLLWDSAARSYQVDETISQQLEDDPTAISVAAIRRRLRKDSSN